MLLSLYCLSGSRKQQRPRRQAQDGIPVFWPIAKSTRRRKRERSRLDGGKSAKVFPARNSVSSDSRHILGDSIRSVGAFLEGARFPGGCRVVSGGREGIFVPIATLLLVDDNPVILEHIRGLLARDQQYQVVGAVNDGDSVRRAYSRLRPDIIVLDISMGDISGIDVAQDLFDSGCKAKIVFLTVHEDPDFINAAMGAGGSAYIVKSRVSNDLIPALDAVLSGKLFVSTCHSH